MTNVRIGYFEDFKSSNTLLMEADAEGLRALAGKFRSLALETLDAIELHDLPFVEVHHGVQVTATRRADDRGIRRVGGDNAFLWERSAEGWDDAADKLDVLTHYGKGHHYLDATRTRSSSRSRGMNMVTIGGRRTANKAIELTALRAAAHSQR